MNEYFDIKVDRVAEKCRKWDRSIIEQQYGPVPNVFIPMWIADMDFKVSDEITQAFESFVKRGMYGYTYTYQAFYDAVIQWQATEHQTKVKQDWITLGYGTVSTLHNLIQAFCDAQQGVLINTPVYEPFARSATDNDIAVICNPLTIKNNRYFIDFELLEKQLKEKKPAIYLFCNPHNPSGRIWTRDEIKQVAALCLKYQVVLVTDEVHSEHILPGHSYYSSLLLEDQYLQNLIMLTSPNKAFNLGGLKTSYSVIPNEKYRRKLREQYRKNSVTSPNPLGILGLITAYQTSKAWRDAMIKYVTQNYVFIKPKLEKLGFEVMKMESSYLIWINIKKFGLTNDDFTNQLARKTGVLLESGSDFVQNGDQFVRMNLAMPFNLVEQAMQRINQFCQNLEKGM